MKKILFFALGLLLITTIACREDFTNNGFDETTPAFNFPQTISFEQKLSAYAVFEAPYGNLVPSKDFHLLELSSPLFTDYAHKQRLVKVPEGMQVEKLADGSIRFPDGTQLVKTFFYYQDERDTSLGKRIIESRLLIKAQGIWNVATYIWNQAQTDATLSLGGSNTQVSWIDVNGMNNATRYHIPSQNQCFSCHQSNRSLTPLGPSLINLNRTVKRYGKSVNQINYLQSIGLLNDFGVEDIPSMANYKNLQAQLSERARAYLAMNCAHCHNPSGWERSSQRRFDFRYEIPLEQTGILSKKEKISRTLVNGRMPFIGTTMLDEEGIRLINEYFKSL